jgi:hypothetical protein
MAYFATLNIRVRSDCGITSFRSFQKQKGVFRFHPVDRYSPGALPYCGQERVAVRETTTKKRHAMQPHLLQEETQSSIESSVGLPPNPGSFTRSEKVKRRCATGKGWRKRQVVRPIGFDHTLQQKRSSSDANALFGIPGPD